MCSVQELVRFGPCDVALRVSKAVASFSCNQVPPPPPALEGMMTVPRYELLGLTELLVSVCGGPEMLIPAHSLAIGVFLPSLV